MRAYTLGLVKQISVDSVVDATSVNQAYVEVEGFQSSTRSISAKASIWVNQAAGPKKKRVTLRNGDNLFELSGGREIYRDGFIVNEIDAEQGFVRFANDVTARIGVAHGNLTEEVLRLQIGRVRAPALREGEAPGTYGHQGALGVLPGPGIQLPDL